MTKKYLFLYYFSFILTCLIIGYSSYKYINLVAISNSYFNEILANIIENVLGIVNLILVVIFTIIILKKRKLKVESIVFPIVFIIFFVIILSMCFLLNNKVMIPYMHFEYYSLYICVGNIFLNIYSLLLIN